MLTKINQKEPFVLKRNQAYIGVLIDDLITKERRNPTECSPPGQNTEPPTGQC